MKLFLPILFLLFVQNGFATIWHVGPTRTYTYCSQVSSLVLSGDTVEIDYATYVNDKQVIWDKDNLFLVGIGGRPRLEAGSTIANDNVNGKGIFVISGANVRVENIEFANATVIDHNGAGIRQEGANLMVHGCKFDGNEMGILCGNISNCKTTVEYCEFLNGGSAANPGYQHNIYINHIDTILFQYNYSYNALAEGHEFKSRAKYTFILYNTIANYQTVDSRNIDIPNGGTAIIMGNVIEQGENSSNSNIVGYGLEGLTNSAPHELYIVNNTFVNRKSKGSFVNITTGTDILFLKNNVMAGAKTGGLIIGTANTLDSTNNFITDYISDCGFEDAANYDYHPLNFSGLVDAGTSITNSVCGYPLIPEKMYVDTCMEENRSNEHAIDIGAFEYGSTTGIYKPKSADIIDIYPNPASTICQLKMPYESGNKTIQLISITGDVILEYSFLSGYLIDVSKMPNGLYLWRFKDDFSPTGKLVVIHE